MERREFFLAGAGTLIGAISAPAISLKPPAHGPRADEVTHNFCGCRYYISRDYLRGRQVAQLNVGVDWLEGLVRIGVARRCQCQQCQEAFANLE